MHVTATERRAEPAVVMRMQAISKAFAGVQALNEVDLDVRAGEVLALLGENGAGKSTLLKILNGDYLPDRGRMLLDDVRVSFASPHDARERGVRVIYQEPEIIPSVTVAENVYVGALPHRGRFYDRRGLTARVQADIDRYGFSDVLRPNMLGGRLSPAQRQLVEILRALVSDVRVIAFDEPTSSLSDHEVSALFTLIRRLRREGVAVIYVSHRMQEVFQVSDRVTVLRDGRLAGNRITAETDEHELIRLMVGRDLGSMFVRESQPHGEVVLQVRGLTSDDVHGISFEVHAGEVVGLAGLVGAGRTELAKAIAGDLPIRSGEVMMAGRRLRLHQPKDAIRAGVGLAPEERKADALLLKRTVRDNVSLAILDRLRRLRVVRKRAERDLVQGYVDRLRIRTPSIEHQVSMLSGGNQQKTVLARWLARRPKLLILDEPTRGIDVGAKAEIYSIISDLAAQGVAILLISSELPEIIGLTDRIVVMRGGRVTGELDQAEATEERVLALAMAEDAGTREREEPGA